VREGYLCKPKRLAFRPSYPPTEYPKIKRGVPDSRMYAEILKEGYFTKGTGLARIHANFKRGVLCGNQTVVWEI